MTSFRFALASCHALPTVTAGAALLYPAPPLEQLDPSVLAANNEIHAAKGSPRYNLAAHQKRAIGAALSALVDCGHAILLHSAGLTPMNLIEVNEKLQP